MKICPLLNVDHNGKLVARAKVRSKHKVIKEIVNRMVDNADDGLDYSGKCFLSHSYCKEDAQAVAELIKASFTKLSGEPVIHDIGTTIAAIRGQGRWRCSSGVKSGWTEGVKSSFNDLC